MTKKNKSFKFGGLEIEATEFGSQGCAILGIRDSGKTSTAMAMAEKLMESGIPIIAFDPIGVWRTLRIPGKGKGYPVVVAGGKAGDLPLTVAGAPEIVRAAMQNGVSLVIDLFDINLSKADWKRIVTSCVKVLLHENGPHGLRHIFIEEAAEFAPQRVGPDSGHVYAVMEQLARMGGNSRLGYTLINQRSEELAKAVLELCDNLLLHRQKGRNSLNSLSKWLDVGAVKGFKEITASLPTLPQGECWAWLSGSDTPVHIKVPAKNSAYPDRRAIHGSGVIKGSKAVDVGAFVKGMRASLTHIEEEAKANDPAELKNKIRELELQLKGKKTPVVDTSKLEAKAHDDGRKRGYAEGFNAGTMDERGRWTAAAAKISSRELPVILTVIKKEKPRMVTVKTTIGDIEKPKLAPIYQDSNFTKPQAKVIDSLVFWRDFGHANPTREQVGVVAGYKPTSGGFGNILSELKKAGIIEYPTTGCISLLAKIESGRVNADSAKERFMGILSNPQKTVLAAFTSDKPYSRDAIADASSYQRTSGGFGNLLSELITLGIIEKAGTGMVKIAPWAWEILS